VSIDEAEIKSKYDSGALARVRGFLASDSIAKLNRHLLAKG